MSTRPISELDATARSSIVTLEAVAPPSTALEKKLSHEVELDPEKHDPQDPTPVTWDGDNDPMNPLNWSTRYKWVVTIIASIMTVNVTFASSAPSTATPQIAAHFGVSNEVATLVTSLFLLGYVFGPPVWGPGSELYGRLPTFRIAMVVYTLLHIGQALAPNIQTLLVVRFLSGFFAVAPLTNCGGLIADIWSAELRGDAMSLFTASVFLGPVLGPIVGGFIIGSGESWQWVFWVMMMFAGTCTFVTLVFLPETLGSVILNKKLKRLRKDCPEEARHLYAEHERQDWSLRGILKRSLFRPFVMLTREPILVLLTIYLSLVYGVLYGLFEAFPIIFAGVHHFTTGQVGLIFIGIGIGATLGSVVNLRFTSHYPALIRKWKGYPPPEQRLFGAMFGAPLLVVGAFWLGWTGNYASVPWYVPALSTVPMGMSINLIFISFLSYVVDTYLMYSASAFAANTIVRSAVAAAFPLFTVQMYRNLGINWASTLIGCIALLLAPIPFLFYRYGSQVRERSKFAPCVDLRIAKELKAEAKAQP